MRPFGRGLAYSFGGCFAVPDRGCVNVHASFFNITMETKKFTQKQAQEMYQTLCDFYDDFAHIDFKKKKRYSIIDMAYITGIGGLIKRIKKENMNI